MQKISVDGGLAPRWRPEGGEIFFLNTRNEVVAVAVSATTTASDEPLSLEPAMTLFASPGSIGFDVRMSWDALPDDRFVILAPHDRPSEATVHIINNWTKLLP